VKEKKGRILPDLEREDSEEAISFAADLSPLFNAIDDGNSIRFLRLLNFLCLFSK
jgi:hypothetical protein